LKVLLPRIRGFVLFLIGWFDALLVIFLYVVAVPANDLRISMRALLQIHKSIVQSASSYVRPVWRQCWPLLTFADWFTVLLAQTYRKFVGSAAIMLRQMLLCWCCSN
jgi:hypothetical protein